MRSGGDSPARSAARAQALRDTALLYGGFVPDLVPAEACPPLEQKVDYDPVRMTEGELDLYLRTALEQGVSDRERILAALEQEGVVPDPEMKHFLAGAVLLSENPSAEDLLNYAEPLMPDPDSPAALCAAEALTARIQLQSRQVAWEESQRQKYEAQETAVRRRLLEARRARREAEDRLYQELENELPAGGE